ncbi:SGT1-domain-containing protein [Melanomma pulvis-pyrius CBS 109.77]|uniref:SGT1-domain-containing protein n=1 Tax=Melanomma pulvis-pyrius CBS 109.77 TaxID=1314802 RepID=A0A6A6XB22_9PLEO|nr:SGT1-domain-containing protein [Melanomma pulvis-pyrius CBS 109.77]
MDEIPKDDFKWFGEGFDGFPKRLPEDVVEYIVFIIDSKLSDIQTRERLQAFQRALTTLEKKFLKEYIWQRDALELNLVREEGRWMLKGSTNFGDSVADEWLIVYLLRELSKEFRDAWIRIYDTDGEFLLIEAANALPKWLNPEVAEHRVWINTHRLLVIPLSKQETPRALKLEDALSIISETPARLHHLPKVEGEAFHRLKGYPAAIAENQHHATLPLPRKVAHLLHLNPSYIAPVVEAFYLRDPISLRRIQPAKSKTSLLFPPEDFVEVSVRFTKVLYAQLLGQNWAPPGPWGVSLEELVKKGPNTEKAEIGIKVAAGIEMLLQHKLHADKKPVREMRVLLEDLESGDDSLPTDAEIAAWAKREDDEAWLNIDFSEFERELAGKGGTEGFGDKSAQDNLKKMVERFNAFIDDEDAGLEGAGGLDPMDMDDDSDAENRQWDDPEDSESDGAAEKEEDDDDDDEYADAEYEEYEKAFEKFMMLSSAEKSILTDDARALALAEEEEEDEDEDEDEEIRKLSKMMEKELFSHDALNLDPNRGGAGKALMKNAASTKLNKGKGKAKLEDLVEEADEDGDEDFDLLDDDYNLADNMLKSFKGQVGMAGPAGNLMGLMGVQFPNDADDEPKKEKAKKH